MPSRERERAIVLRRFDGVSILVDSAFLGPSYLRAAQNWIPGETFRLTKTPGSRAYAYAIPDVVKVRLLRRCYSGINRYLYAVVTPSAGGVDRLWVSQNEGAWTRVQLAGGGNADFTISGGTYDGALLNGILYIGNGVDPLLAVTVGSTAQSLFAITAFTDGSAAPAINPDPGSQILSGTYSYCWAIFDHTATRWIERGQTRTVTVSTTGDSSLTFPAPSGFASNGGALSSQFRAHLFIAPINLPVEFGHDHNPEGRSAATSLTIRALIADGPPLPLRGVARTGNIMRAHFGRLCVTGDPNDDTAVWATYAAVPGLEQAVYNAGIFFPVNARLPRPTTKVTALGLAVGHEGVDDPRAPIIICTLSETYLHYGDILDDPNAAFLKVAGNVGCIEKETMCETPQGTFWVGLESVYCMPPMGGRPIDVGWPIRPAIVAIPQEGRANCRAIYHKGFLKLAIAIPGQTKCIQQWWLDLRHGLGRIPSWWGPSPRIPVAAWTTGQQDPTEPDRGYVAYDVDETLDRASWGLAEWNIAEWIAGGGGAIEYLHQSNTYSELGTASKIVSTVVTGDLDDGLPFDRKNFTRVRVTAFPGSATSLAVDLSVDGGFAGAFDSMPLPGAAGDQWNVDSWNTAQWGQATISEGESVAPTQRPRGRTGAVKLVHSEAVALALRDLELRYLPVERPVRSRPDDPTS